MKAKDFGGLQTTQGENYFYETSGFAAADSSIIVLANAQAQTLLDIYHRKQPLKNSFDRAQYGSFSDRDINTRARIVSHLFAGPLQPFRVEPFYVSSSGIGYMRHGFRALTNAMVTMGLPQIPIEVRQEELRNLENLVGKPQSVTNVTNFEQQRGVAFVSLRKGFTPAQCSYQMNFPWGDEKHNEIVHAAEAGLFLLEHETLAVSHLPGLTRRYGLDDTASAVVLKDAAELHSTYDRQNQRRCLMEMLKHFHPAERHGVAVDYKEAVALHRWDHDDLKRTLVSITEGPTRPMRPAQRQQVFNRQQAFISSLPLGPNRTNLQTGLNYDATKFGVKVEPMQP